MRRILPVLALVLGGLLIAGPALAVDSAETMDAIVTAVDVSSIRTAAFAAGSVALVAAFTIGGGFRVAKKAYNWIFAKMGS